MADGKQGRDNEKKKVDGEKKSHSLHTFWDILVKVAVPIVFMTAATILHHEVRLTKIEEAQATKRDLAEVLVRLAKIEETKFTKTDGQRLSSELQNYVLDHFPPPWLKDDLDEIKQSLRDDFQEIKTSVRDIEERLRALERNGVSDGREDG